MQTHIVFLLPSGDAAYLASREGPPGALVTVSGVSIKHIGFRLSGGSEKKALEKFDAPAFQQQLAILTGLQAHLISVTVHEQGK